MHRKPDRVVDEAEQALSLARTARDRTAEAFILRLRAHAHRAGNRYAQALEDYRRSTRLFAAEDRGEELPVNAIGTIDALMYLGRYAEARRTALDARRRFDRAGDISRRARVETNLGNIHHRLDEPEKALGWYDRALPTFHRLGETDAEALVEFNRGNVLTVLGRTRGAREAYQAALGIAARNGMPGRVRQIRYNIAYLDFMENRFPESLEELARLRPAFEDGGDRRHAALCRLDEAEILLRLNLWDEAGSLAGEARAAFDDLGMSYEAAKSTAFLGAAAYRLGNLRGAERDIRAASRRFDAEGNVVWRGETALFLARIHLERGHWKRAIRSARSARRFLAGSPWSGGKVRAAVVEALALRGLGERKAAIRRLDEAASLRSGSPWLKMEVMEARGLLAREAGDLRTARRRFRAAIRAVEGIRALLSGDDFRAAFLRNRDRPYVALAALELDAGRPGEAFRILERGRSRALLDMLARPGHPAGRRSRQRRDLEKKALDLLGRLGGEYHRIDLARERGLRGHTHLENGQSLKALESQTTRLLHTLSRGTKQAVPVLDTGISDVRKLLRPDETMIAYFEHGDDLGAFVVTRTGFEVRTGLASLDRLTEVAAALRFQWGRFRLDPLLIRRHEEQLKRLAKSDLASLYDMLLRQLPLPRGRRLILIPTAAMRTLPFGALFDGRRYLAEERIVSVTPGAGVFAACRSRAGGKADILRRPLLFGVSDELAPEVIREIDDVEGSLPGSRVFRAEDATVSRFRAEAGRASLIHLAAHGLFRADRPNLSGLRLADRWLYGYDVHDLTLQSDLVTLSACASGESTAWGQGEWMGLARSFLMAGSRRVLVGLWDVHDAATRQLMASFYSELNSGSGRDVSAALARVQGRFARSGAHPYYWSGFMLVGDS